MDIHVRGRNVEVPDHFRHHVAEKLQRVERYDHKIMRIDVELYHERNRRQSSSCQRIEITCSSRGPVIRSEACGSDFYGALDVAVGRLDHRLSRSADRRRVHHGTRTPTSVAEATSAAAADASSPSRAGTAVLLQEAAERDVEAGPGRVVREKEHSAKPISVDQALFEMELVGHDFYLFSDSDTGQPSVVYRRKGYDYGVIRLIS